MAKETPYANLVKARKQCRACSDFINLETCAEGVVDCDEIGSWSKWQGNLSAALMIVG